MEAIVTLRPTGGTPEANGTPKAAADANGAHPASKAPTAKPTKRLPSLQDAVSTLPLTGPDPLTGPGPLTRERLAPLAQAGDLTRVLMYCLDEMARLPGLVEVVRTATEAEGKSPFETRRLGADHLCDLIAEKIHRTAEVLWGVYAELDQAAPRS